MKTKSSSLTSKERLMCSLKWQEPDRVPLQIYLTPEMKKTLDAYFRGRDVLECLGIDFRYVGPEYKRTLKAPHDGIRYDLWGSGYRRVEHG